LDLMVLSSDLARFVSGTNVFTASKGLPKT
jgi:hypothetical protein